MKPLRLSLSICFLLLIASTAWAASLTHGPLVGNVTPTSGLVFVRTDVPASGHVRVLCCSLPLDTLFTTTVDTDYTAQVTVGNLLPALSYTIQVFICDPNPSCVLQTPTSTFRTFPAPGTTPEFTFVVLTDFAMGPSGTTCSGGPGFDECPDLGALTFASVDAENPALVIIGGDFDHRNTATYCDGALPNCLPFPPPYESCGEDRPCKYRKMWKDLYTCANWGGSDLCGHILRKYPLVHAWDDHDYGVNNGNGNYNDKPLARKMFKQYFPSYGLPDCPDDQCGGIWQKFSYAYADFFILDSRSQRTPPCQDPPACSGDESLLKGFPVQGAQDQWTWLTQGLLASPADNWKFIWSPVVFNQTVQKTDSWFGYPAERQALVNFITANNIKNVIFLSGDLHAGAIDNGLNGDFPEMLTPAPNFTRDSPKHCQSAKNDERGLWSHGMYTTGAASRDPCNGYGVISVSPTAVTLTIKDSNGNTTNLICQPNISDTDPCGSPTNPRHISPLTVGAQ